MDDHETTAVTAADQDPDVEHVDEPVEETGMGKAVLRGAVLGSTLTFAAVTIAGGLAGIGWGAAAGLALFIAFWGGLGLGSMSAGVVWATRIGAGHPPTGHA